MAVAEGGVDREARTTSRRDDAGARRCRAGLGRKGGVGRSYADAPEIDGRVACCRRKRRRRRSRRAGSRRAKIIAVEGHDLVGVPI
jgi:hypothetical protein